MGRATRTRYTIAVAWSMDMFNLHTYGVFLTYELAAKQADVWARLVKDEHPGVIVEVVPLHPATGRNFREDLNRYAVRHASP